VGGMAWVASVEASTATITSKRVSLAIASRPPQRQAVIKEPNGTLRVVSQAALHIAPARSARQQGRHVQIGEGLSRGSGSSGAAATARPAGRGALAQGAGQWKGAGLGQRA